MCGGEPLHIVNFTVGSAAAVIRISVPARDTSLAVADSWLHNPNAPASTPGGGHNQQRGSDDPAGRRSPRCGSRGLR
jgi:hypothetical protein